MDPSAKNPRRILVVDDSNVFRSVVVSHLAGMADTFLEAESGAQALELLHQHPVALVIADISMPGMTGIELTEAIRNHARQEVRITPVVLVTGEDLERVRPGAERAGADELVQKPIAQERLRAIAHGFLTESGP